MDVDLTAQPMQRSVHESALYGGSHVIAAVAD